MLANAHALRTPLSTRTGPPVVRAASATAGDRRPWSIRRHPAAAARALGPAGVTPPLGPARELAALRTLYGT